MARSYPLIAMILLSPGLAFGQSLDEAVNSLLAAGQTSLIACEGLLALGGAPAPGSGLATICGRGSPSGSGSSQATGGGAGTSTSAPDIVHRRIEEAEGEAEAESSNQDVAVEVGHRVNLFFSGEYESLDRDVTRFEDGYKSNIGRLAVGADKLLDQGSVIGLVIDVARQDGDFSGGGSFEVDSYGVTAYGSASPTANSSVQLYAGYTRQKNDRDRIATFSEENDFYAGNPAAGIDADRFRAGLLYNLDLNKGAVTYGPHAGVDWTNTEFDAYTEADPLDSGLALRFGEDDVTSLRSTLGLHIQAAYGKSFGVLQPYASLDWKHEFDEDQRNITVSFVDDANSAQFSYQTEAPDRDFFEASAGLVVVLPNGIQAFANLRTLLGHRYFDSYAGTLGFRVEL